MLLLVDSGLVDEHVVVVLVEDHKVVAEDNEVIVAKVEEKGAKIVFLYVVARRVCCWLGLVSP